MNGSQATPSSVNDPEEVAVQLGAKLASGSRHVCFLTGAGSSRAAGLPDLAGLQAEVVRRAPGHLQTLVEQLLAGRNLEEALSRLRRISSLIEDGGTYGGFNTATALELDAAMCEAIISAITAAASDLTPFINLAAWAAGEYYRSPIEIFTVNYDLLLEEGLEAVAAPYFDGFVGSLRGRFRPELVEAVDPSAGGLPASFVRVWKLHGSITWAMETDGDARRVVRLGSPVFAGEMAAIYPSEEKYDASRRVPFVVLMDRFRRALLEPETLLIVSGYSFGDQHLNEIIFDAAQRRPRSDFVVCCFGDLPSAVADVAERLRNVTLLGGTEAIVGGIRGPWSPGEEAVADVWSEGRFLLGDFAHLARFLGRSRGIQAVGGDHG